MEVLEAVDCLNGLILLCKNLASELNILYTNNIKMCTFTLEPGVFSVTGQGFVGDHCWELRLGFAVVLYYSVFVKTDLLQDRALSAQKRSRSHRL